MRDINSVIPSGPCLTDDQFFKDGKWNMLKGGDNIAQNLKLITQSYKQSRAMNPTFGSDINLQIFDQVDDAFIDIFKQYLKEAASSQLSYITLVSIDINKESEKSVRVYVKFRLRNSNILQDFTDVVTIGG